MSLDTIPNDYPELRSYVKHTLQLPECCPVSRNPRPGSTLTIVYRPTTAVLEVYSLRRLIDSFRGGAPDGTRNMEAMVQRIHQLCCEALPDIAVRTRAAIILDTGDQLEITCLQPPPGLRGLDNIEARAKAFLEGYTPIAVRHEQ